MYNVLKLYVIINVYYYKNSNEKIYSIKERINILIGLLRCNYMYDLCLFKEIMYICICIWFYMSVVMFRLFFYVILIYKNCWLKIELYLVVKKKNILKI